MTTINRVTLHAGLALVAWGRRSSNRRNLISDDVIARHEWEHDAIDREAARAASRPMFLGI